MQRRIIFPRHFTRHDPVVAQQFEDLDIWKIETEDGESAAWFLPATGRGTNQAAPAVIFACGNAELAEDWAHLLRPYREAGVHVLLPDYRGYGFSDGSPSQKAIVSDFIRFYDLLAAQETVDSGRIFFHGRSLGGGVVCALSMERPPAALVLSSTFTSVKDMARRYLFPAFLVADPFDNRKALSKYKGPVLLLHGRKDGVTPYTHSQKLKKIASDAELAPLPGDHNNMEPYMPGGEAWENILNFLGRQKIKII